MMDKRTPDFLLVGNTKAQSGKKIFQSGMATKFVCLVSLLISISACDFISQDGSPNIPKNNPGASANLPAGTPLNPSQNLYRMTEAQREAQKCDEFSCDPVQPLRHIQYIYDDTTGVGGFLNRTLEREPDINGFPVSYRLYIYDAINNNRLDKVAIADDASSNFHTLHDYFYDDENDLSDSTADIGTSPPQTDGYNANVTLAAPKLRKEYICSINIANPAPSATITTTTSFPNFCNRDTADQVISYIYYGDGHLFRKEFDTDNDGSPDHQKIYYYSNGQLRRVDTDNFYNGPIDERYFYEQKAFAGEAGATTLRIFLDNNTLKNSNINRTVSYQLDYSLDTVNGLPVRECYFGGELDFLDSRYDPVRDGISGACLSTTIQYLQWIFTWEANNCWAGGLDDIDPETRAIRYLCSQ